MCGSPIETARRGEPATIQTSAARNACSTAAELDWILRDVSFAIEPGRDGGHRRPHRRRQDHDHLPDDALLRCPEGRRSRSMASMCASMDVTDLRRRFGVVLQDPFLFTGTIAENIRLGTEWITDERTGAGGRRGQRGRLHPLRCQRF